MISFDVDPNLYVPSILCVIAIIVFIIPTLYKDTQNIGLFAIMIFSIIGIVIFIGLIACGSTYTNTITICAHTEGNYMKVVDTNQNLYYVIDDLTQMKVKDNITVKVNIEDKWGSKYIYSIDAPITCGNSSCGVSST